MWILYDLFAYAMWIWKRVYFIYLFFDSVVYNVLGWLFWDFFEFYMYFFIMAEK